MKDWEKYRKEFCFGFNRPIEFNHAGVKLRLVHVDHEYEIQPFVGHPVRVNVDGMDEEKETVTISSVRDGGSLEIPFSQWAVLRPKWIGPAKGLDELFWAGSSTVRARNS